MVKHVGYVAVLMRGSFFCKDEFATVLCMKYVHMQCFGRIYNVTVTISVYDIKWKHYLY